MRSARVSERLSHFPRGFLCRRIAVIGGGNYKLLGDFSKFTGTRSKIPQIPLIAQSLAMKRLLRNRYELKPFLSDLRY